MPPRKKELPESMDPPASEEGAGAPETAAETAAELPEAQQADAHARTKRKAALPPSAEPGAADAAADAPSAPKRPARKKADAPSDAELAYSPEPAEQPVKPLVTLLEQAKLKKKERNETHEKDRVFIRKDLKARLDALAENRGKGFKTLLLNYGLEKALDELEQANQNISDESPDNA